MNNSFFANKNIATKITAPNILSIIFGENLNEPMYEPSVAPITTATIKRM